MSVGDTNFDFSDVVDEAVARSGGEGSTAADILSVRRSMRLLTERWIAQGYNTWRIQTMVMNFLGGNVGMLTLPAYVDDVVNVSASQTSDNDNRSSIKRISAAEHAALTKDITEGRPSQYWLQRVQPSPVLHLYPTSACVLTVTYVHRPESYDRLSDLTSDIPGRWLEALVLGLALDLARKRPPYDNGLISRLTSEYASAEANAQAADRDRVRFRYRITGMR